MWCAVLDNLGLWWNCRIVDTVYICCHLFFAVPTIFFKQCVLSSSQSRYETWTLHRSRSCSRFVSVQEHTSKELRISPDSRNCIDNLPSGKRLHNYGQITMFHGKTHYKWPFSIAMLVDQRVYTTFHDHSTFQPVSIRRASWLPVLTARERPCFTWAHCNIQWEYLGGISVYPLN